MEANGLTVVKKQKKFKIVLRDYLVSDYVPDIVIATGLSESMAEQMAKAIEKEALDRGRFARVMENDEEIHTYNPYHMNGDYMPKERFAIVYGVTHLDDDMIEAAYEKYKESL